MFSLSILGKASQAVERTRKLVVSHLHVETQISLKPISPDSYNYF